MDGFPTKRYSSPEELLGDLQERSDDMESVVIQVADAFLLIGPDGKTLAERECSVLIRTCSGKSLLLHREDAEMLINDGIWNRMKIPIQLLPTTKPDEG